MTKKKLFTAKRGPKTNRAPFRRQVKTDKNVGMNIFFTPEHAQRVLSDPKGKTAYIREMLERGNLQFSWEQAIARVIDAMRMELHNVSVNLNTLPVAKLFLAFMDAERMRFLICRRAGIFPMFASIKVLKEWKSGSPPSEGEALEFCSQCIKLLRENAEHFREDLLRFLRSVVSLEEVIDACHPWFPWEKSYEIIDLKYLSYCILGVLHLTNNPKLPAPNYLWFEKKVSEIALIEFGPANSTPKSAEAIT